MSTATNLTLATASANLLDAARIDGAARTRYVGREVLVSWDRSAQRYEVGTVAQVTVRGARRAALAEVSRLLCA